MYSKFLKKSSEATKIITRPIVPIFAEFFKNPSMCPMTASELTGIRFENIKTFIVS